MGALTHEATIKQLKESNAALVGQCLELGQELFAMRYKREEMAQRMQHQVDQVRTGETAAAGRGAVLSTGGGSGGGGSRGGAGGGPI